MKTKNNKSKITQAIVEAYNRGFRVLEDGKMISSTGEEITPYKDEDGYMYWALNIKNSRITFPIHRLQAYQKYGCLVFYNKNMTRHLNGVKDDNSFDNILIGNNKDNVTDFLEQRNGKKVKKQKYNHKKILEDRYAGMSLREICKKHNIKNRGTLSWIINKSIKSKEGVKLSDV